ncbi:MAG: putative ABC transporter permease [Lachnospiraceae bacterium]|nr:putative ABC transporter permease [Lachnospiraceae bacterium]
MFKYTIGQLFFYFIFYCFLGWIIESTYVSVSEKKLTNRGFLKGPVIPIYGCGAMTMYFCTTPFRQWPVLVFIAGTIGCSVLEYFTGWAMEAIFKIRYWDYSDKKFNLNGYISLFTSLFWGFGSLCMCYFIQNGVEYVASFVPERLFYIIVFVEVFIFAIDLALSFKAAFDLRSLLIRLEKAKDELRLMARRLDVMIAYAGESLDERKAKMGEALDNWASGLEEKMDKASDGFDNRINSLTDSIESKFLSIKKAIEEKPQSFAESMKEEFFELKGRFSAGKDNKGFQAFVKEFRMHGMFKGNPTLSSKTFKDSFEFIKAAVTKSDKKDDEE